MAAWQSSQRTRNSNCPRIGCIGSNLPSERAFTSLNVWLAGLARLDSRLASTRRRPGHTLLFCDCGQPLPAGYRPGARDLANDSARGRLGGGAAGFNALVGKNLWE